MAWSYLLGPNIANFGQLPDHPDGTFLFIDDHIGNSMRESEMGVLRYLLAKADVDINSTVERVVTEYIYSEELKPREDNIMFVPVQAILSVQEIADYIQPEKIEKRSAFNFSINKTRLNRALLLQILRAEELTTDTYSLCGKNPIAGFEPKYYLSKRNTLLEDTIKNGIQTNGEIYRHYLKKNVYDPSYISLITEPSWIASSTFITEKTVYAFESHTIPIWVGGYKHAEKLEEIGFNVFNDIVDHSYQDLEDPEERIYSAISLNLELLKDADFLADYYEKNITKFLSNQNLIKNNQLTVYVDKEIARLDHWPDTAHYDALKLCNLFPLDG